MSDIELVREVYTAMAARDVGRRFELIDPTFVVTQDPALPWGGRHVGHDGFATFALALSGTIDSAVGIDAVVAADGDVIQLGRTRGTVRANGVAFDIPVAAHFAIDTAAMLEALAQTP